MLVLILISVILLELTKAHLNLSKNVLTAFIRQTNRGHCSQWDNHAYSVDNQRNNIPGCTCHESFICFKGEHFHVRHDIFSCGQSSRLSQIQFLSLGVKYNEGHGQTWHSRKRPVVLDMVQISALLLHDPGWHLSCEIDRLSWGEWKTVGAARPGCGSGWTFRPAALHPTPHAPVFCPPTEIASGFIRKISPICLYYVAKADVIKREYFYALCYITP